MKQTLIILSLSMVFASCGTGGNDQTTALQKQVDSLTAVLAPKEPKKMPMATLERGKALFVDGQNFVSNGYPIDSFIIPWKYGQECAGRWGRRFLTENGYRNIVINQSPACSFIIPRSSLTYLMENGADFVVVYLAVDSNDQLTIVYDGAAKKQDDPGNDTVYEQRIWINQQDYVLDNVWPCPTCDKVGLSRE